MTMRRWQDEQDVDPAVCAVALDCRVPLRMELPLDLLEAANAAFHLAENHTPSGLQVGIDRAPTRKRRLEIDPPAGSDQPEQSLHEAGVRRVIDQGCSFPIQLHSEVGAEDCAGARSDGRADRWICALDPCDDRWVDPDRVADRTLGDAGAKA